MATLPAISIKNLRSNGVKSRNRRLTPFARLQATACQLIEVKRIMPMIISFPHISSFLFSLHKKLARGHVEANRMAAPARDGISAA